MNDKNKNARNLVSKSELLLLAALRQNGLLFPDSDVEVARFESDPTNRAELPEALKDPNRIIMLAEQPAGSGPKVVSIRERQTDDDVDSYKQAAGFYRSQNETSSKDEEEISTVLDDIARKRNKGDDK